MESFPPSLVEKAKVKAGLTGWDILGLEYHGAPFSSTFGSCTCMR
jgi:hypothetical protein